MDQEEDPDIGRFKPKGDPNEPREPFLPDEMFEEEHQVPSLEALHIPSTPITNQKLKTFLLELKPMVEEILGMSRKDQHQIGKSLDEVKTALQESDLSDEVKQLFSKLVDHFHQLLTHSRPEDREAALEKITEIEARL